MGLFDSMVFLNEGEQADAYKARKAKEAEDARKAAEEDEKRQYERVNKRMENNDDDYNYSLRHKYHSFLDRDEKMLSVKN